MSAATYERKKDGIFREGRRVFMASALHGAREGVAIEGTPWTLFHQELVTISGDRMVRNGDEIRLSNLAQGTDGFHIMATQFFARIRFATLVAPGIRTEGTRLRLNERNGIVAELIPSWRDSDMEAGILARVQTSLQPPASDAAALLLFRLEHLPPISERQESERPLAF